MNRILLLFTFILLLPSPLHANGTGNPRWALQRLDVDLAIDYEESTIDSSATLSLTNAGNQDQDHVLLQLGRLMSVESVLLDGQPVQFTQDIVRLSDWPAHQILSLDIDLERQIPAGASATVSVHYSGYLVGYAETGMLYVQDHIDPEFTILRTEAYAFPQIGGPSYEDRAAQPRIDFDFTARIRLPSTANDQVLAGPVAATRIVEDDQIVWTMKGDTPLPFLNLAIAPFQKVEADGATIFVRKEHLDTANEFARRLDDAMGQLQQWFGPPPDKKLVMIDIPEGWGSQAHPVAGILLDSSAFEPTSDLQYLVHELAHIWHPSESDTPPDRWNEGFATFVQWRISNDENEEESTYFEQRARSALDRLGDKSEYLSLDALGENEATGRAYGQGGIFFSLLYQILGQENFDRAHALLFERARGQAISNRQWLDALVPSGCPAYPLLISEWVEGSYGLASLKDGETLTSMADRYGRCKAADR